MSFWGKERLSFSSSSWGRNGGRSGPYCTVEPVAWYVPHGAAVGHNKLLTRPLGFAEAMMQSVTDLHGMAITISTPIVWLGVILPSAA